MANNPQIPQYQQSIVDGKNTDRVWYNFFQIIAKKLSTPTSWTTSTRPVVNAGYVGYNTDTLKFEGFDGTNWIDLN